MNPQATFVERDIRDGIDLDGADVVFHLAAQTDVQTSVRRPAGDADVNVVGTVQVLEAALEAGARVVFTSTGGAIYGECPVARDRATPRAPGSPYGIAKLCAEEYLGGFNRIHGTTHVVARLGNVFGPRQSPSLEGGVVSIFLERMARGEETVIFGDGLQMRDFVYVGDVVDGAARRGRPRRRDVQRRHGDRDDRARAARRVRRGRGRGVRATARARAPRRPPPLGARRVARRLGARVPGEDVARRRARPDVGLDGRLVAQDSASDRRKSASWMRRFSPRTT